MKDQIRKQVLAARSRLTPDERRSRSAEIERRLFGLPEFRAAPLVLFFASFQSEVETHFMVRRALAEGRRVALPKVQGRDLALLEIRSFDSDVSPGAWGIPEPDRGEPVRPEDLGLVIVPGAVFDQAGNRVGYGAGYYDRLLASYRGPTVALAFELQVVSSVPAERHDVPVGKIVTEKRIIEANNKQQAPDHK